MNKSKYKKDDRLSEHEYHILFLEIQNQILTSTLSMLTDKSESQIAQYYGSNVLDIIKSATDKENRKIINELIAAHRLHMADRYK